MTKLLAQNVPAIFGKIDPPPELGPLVAGGKGAPAINLLLNNIVGLFFGAAGFTFILMFAWGAVQMILSQGDKEAVGKARSKITWAIIGIALLSLSYFIFQLLEDLTGFTFFT